MDARRLERIIKKAITPRADIQALQVCFSSLRANRDASIKVFSSLCEMSLYKATRFVNKASSRWMKEFRAVACEYLTARCCQTLELEADTVLAVMETRDDKLFQKISDRLSSHILSEIFSVADSAAACWFFRNLLLYAPQETYQTNKRLFCEFLNRYDSGGDRELSKLLPLLIEQNDVPVLSKLFETVGMEQLESLYGRTLWDELDRLIICGCKSEILWRAYIDRFFSREHTFEELLVQGLWYVQTYAPDTSTGESLLAYFKISAIEALGANHPLIPCLEDAALTGDVSQEYRAKYDALLNSLWDRPLELSAFLDATERCNPYGKASLAEDEYHILKKTDLESYHLLGRLFEQGIDCKIIVKIFFGTKLRYNLPLEDLLDGSLRYGVLAEVLTELRQQPFDGKIEKENEEEGNFIVAPHSYRVLMIHAFVNDYHLYEQIGVKDGSIRKTILYSIIDYKNGFIQIWPYAASTEKTLPWEETVALLDKALKKNKASGGTWERLINAMNFSIDQFINNFDLNLMNRVLEERAEQFERIVELFHLAKWNSAFLAKEANIAANICESFKKYQDTSRSFFRSLFAGGVKPEAILDFYLSSVYKWILPLEQFLALADKASMLPALSERTFFCKVRLPDKEAILNFTLCRLRNVFCAPICEIIGVVNVRQRELLQAVCINYTLRNGAVTHIDFQNVTSHNSNARTRGRFFGYIARNPDLGMKKKAMIPRLPPVETYDKRELVFCFVCMDAAIHIRKTSGPKILSLLQAMGNKNPFSIRLGLDVSDTFLRKVREARTKERIEDSRNDLVSIILNTHDLHGIAEIYLNTSLKFYTSPEELSWIIAERKPAMAGRIGSLFENCGLTAQEREKWFSFLRSCSIGRNSKGLAALWEERLSAIPEDSGKFREAFKTAVRRFILEHGELSAAEKMKEFLLRRVGAWMTVDARFEETSVLSSLRFIGNTYSDCYQNNGFIDEAFRLVALYYGEESERQFREQILPTAWYRKYARNASAGEWKG